MIQAYAPAPIAPDGSDSVTTMFLAGFAAFVILGLCSFVYMLATKSFRQFRHHHHYRHRHSH